MYLNIYTRIVAVWNRKPSVKTWLDSICAVIDYIILYDVLFHVNPNTLLHCKYNASRLTLD